MCLLTTSNFSMTWICRLRWQITTKSSCRVDYLILQEVLLKLLHKDPQRLILLLLQGRRVWIVTSESVSENQRRNSLSKLVQDMIDPSNSFWNHSKATLSSVMMKSLVNRASLVIKCSVCTLKQQMCLLVDLLLSKTWRVGGFEVRRVRDRLLINWIRSRDASLLQAILIGNGIQSFFEFIHLGGSLLLT